MPQAVWHRYIPGRCRSLADAHLHEPLHHDRPHSRYHEPRRFCQQRRARFSRLRARVATNVSQSIEGVFGLTKPNHRPTGGEINIFAILILEEEIRGHERIISKLELARKVLLGGSISPRYVSVLTKTLNLTQGTA